MPINDPKEVFVQILSSVRQGTEQYDKDLSGDQSGHPASRHKRSHGGKDIRL